MALRAVVYLSAGVCAPLQAETARIGLRPLLVRERQDVARHAIVDSCAPRHEAERIERSIVALDGCELNPPEGEGVEENRDSAALRELIQSLARCPAFNIEVHRPVQLVGL